MANYEQLCEEVGKIIKLDLKPDENSSCLIRFGSGLGVQFEPDKYGEYLLVAAELGEVPAGAFRMQMFESALKANGAPWPRYGRLSFRPDNNMLYLCEEFLMDTLHPAILADFLMDFKDTGEKWKDAIESGRVPVLDEMSGPGSGGMMGLT